MRCCAVLCWGVICAREQTPKLADADPEVDSSLMCLSAGCAVSVAFAGFAGSDDVTATPRQQHQNLEIVLLEALLLG